LRRIASQVLSNRVLDSRPRLVRSLRWREQLAEATRSAISLT